MRDNHSWLLPPIYEPGSVHQGGDEAAQRKMNSVTRVEQTDLTEF